MPESSASSGGSGAFEKNSTAATVRSRATAGKANTEPAPSSASGRHCGAPSRSTLPARPLPRPPLLRSATRRRSGKRSGDSRCQTLRAEGFSPSCANSTRAACQPAAAQMRCSAARSASSLLAARCAASRTERRRCGSRGVKGGCTGGSYAPVQGGRKGTSCGLACHPFHSAVLIRGTARGACLYGVRRGEPFFRGGRRFSDMARGIGEDPRRSPAWHIQRVEYPASRDELVATAEDNEAPAEAINFLKALPKDRYQSAEEVLRDFAEAERRFALGNAPRRSRAQGQSRKDLRGGPGQAALAPASDGWLRGATPGRGHSAVPVRETRSTRAIRARAGLPVATARSRTALQPG